MTGVLVGQLFPFGQTVMTSGVAYDVRAGLLNPTEFLVRHGAGDWGDLGAEDKQMNDEALASGEDRIFSSYKISGIDGESKLWIITEADRSVSTLLYPSEY